MQTAHAVLSRRDGRTTTPPTQQQAPPNEYDLEVEFKWDDIPEKSQGRNVLLLLLGKDLTDDHVSQVVSTLVDAVHTINFHGRESCKTYKFNVKWHTHRPAFEQVIEEGVEQIRKELLS